MNKKYKNQPICIWKVGFLMKKILIVLLLVIGILLFSKKDYYGDDAIRFRVISNSNSSRDIFMKEMVVNKISGYVFNDYEDKEVTRKNIISNISNIEEEIDKQHKRYRDLHIKRLHEGTCSAYAGAIFLDLLSNLERIGDHSTNIAESVIENN